MSSYPGTLVWSEVDPARWPFDASRTDDDRALALGVLARGRGRVEQDLDEAFVAAYGRWALGWRWARDEGSIGGGVVSSWCCHSHTVQGHSDEAIATRAAAALREWRAWIERLVVLFDQLAPRTDDPEGRLSWAGLRLVEAVAEETGAGDAWYAHCEQVLAWYLEHHGVSTDRAHHAVTEAIAGRFESWCTPSEALSAEVGRTLAAEALRHVVVQPADDSLAQYLGVRATIDWAAVAPVPPHRGRDGHAVYIDEVDASRDRARAERLRAALRMARAYAAGGALLSVELLSELQEVMVPAGSALRASAAFAKRGNERYGFDEGTHARFAAALDEADDASVTLLGRAARAYLDVCFFHPFVDGNARAARLVFDWILAREGVVLADVAALFRGSIPAGDADAARAWLSLASTLAVASARPHAH